MPPCSPFAIPLSKDPVKNPLFIGLKGHDIPVPPTEQLQALVDELRGLKARPQKVLHFVKESRPRIDQGLERYGERMKARDNAPRPMIVDPGSPEGPSLADLSKEKLARHGTPNSVGESISFKKSKSKDKKKRKRDDEEPDRSTPSISSISVPSIKIKAPIHKNNAFQDFDLPKEKDRYILHPQFLHAQKPPEMPPLDTQPLRPEDVKEDFSKMKAPPNQTSVHHFYSYIDPYLRPLREEDIGLLEYTADEVEPYIVPKLGKHYLQQWADSDQGIFPTPGTYDLAPPPGPPNPGFDPSQATDRELTREDVGHGPLSERVLSALIPLSDEPGKDIWPSVKTAEDAMTGRPGGSGAAASRKERALLGGKNGLEERLGGTLRYHAILDPSGPNVPDFSNAQSDNVAVALRDMQQELRQVIAQNKARKSRLAERAKDLLAKQEYVETRDQIDKSILGLYTRQQKAQGKDAKELSGRDRDKKKKKRIVNDEEEEETKKEKIPASALGLGVDVETNHLLVSDQMMELIRLRRNWIDKVGGILKARERDAEEEAEVDEEATVGVLESEGTGGGVPSSRTSTVMPSDRDQESLQPSDNVLDDSAMDIT